MHELQSSPCESSSTIEMLTNKSDSTENNEVLSAWNIRKFGLVLAFFQVMFIVLFAIFVQYDWDALPVSHRSPLQAEAVLRMSINKTLQIDDQKNTLAIPNLKSNDPRTYELYSLRDYFSMYGDIQVMIFLAFGLLMACFKRYGYSATGIALVLAAFVVQWATLMHGLLDLQDGHIKLSVITLISADFSIAAILISTCVLLGTLSPLQYLILAFLEVIFYALNVSICQKVLHIVDCGGSIYLHVFAAYFGLAVSVVMNRPKGSVKYLKQLTYGSKFSELLALIGTLLLLIYWPSFNSVFAPADLQHRAVLNTALSFVASIMGAFSISAILSQEKFSMTIIQNGALAGGVAIGSTADLMIQPFAALIIGFSAGAIAVIGFRYLNPVFEKKLNIIDICGVQYLHGLPGILAGLISALACGIATKEAYGTSFYRVFPSAAPLKDTEALAELQELFPSLEPGQNRSQWTQAGIQLIALAASIFLAAVTGSVTGLILKLKILDPLQMREMMNDDEIWLLPKSLTYDEEADLRDSLDRLGRILANRKEIVHNGIIRDQLRGLEACLKA